MTHETYSSPNSIGIVPVYKEDRPLAEQLANKWGFELSPKLNKKIEQGFYLELSAGCLSLLDASKPKEGGVCVDFASEALSYRRQHGGGKQEFVAKAVGTKGKQGLNVIDATGGLGRDAFILASLGCSVTLIERSPVVAALLENGIERASINAELMGWLPNRMQLIYGDSKAILSDWQQDKPDVVYLDPMFPHRKKSALVKKEMRLFQVMLGDDADANELLAPALRIARNRVVVKRPASAESLKGKKPSSTVNSKKHRFDIYFTHQS